MIRPNNLLAWLVCSLFLGVTITLAQSPLPADQIRQGETKQAQIRSQTQHISDQLGSIIDEFKRNGLDGEDVAVLGAIRSVLNKLSEKEMQKVIDLLQSARSSANDGASRRNVAGAVANQKYIVVQMRQLLLEYQRQQALYELSIRLAALAERQHVNLKGTVDLAKTTQGRTGSQFDDSQRASLQVQQADQQTLKDEVVPILAKLEAMAKDLEGLTKDRLNKALQLAKDGGLKPAMESAVEDLKSANLFRAAGSEKTVRDQLRELSRQVAPPKDTLAALRDAAAQLEKAIDKQKQLIEETKTMNKGEWEKQKQTAQELESRQADLVDQADQMRKDLEPIAPQAANELKQSTDQMQEARADLNERNRDKALKDEQNALNKLETAKNEVQDAIAKAEPAKEYEDKLAAAKELQERTRELIKQEEQIKDQTAANERKQQELKNLSPRQGDVENQTRDLQKDTFAQVPEAAQPMGEAATQMDKAEQVLAKPENARTAQEAETAAISSLKQADQVLDKKIAELEKATQDLAALKDAREKVAELITDQQKVELETGKAAAVGAASAAAKPEPGKPAPSKPKDLAPKQGELAKETDQVRNDLSNLEKSAAAPLEDAKDNMSQAKGNLEKNDAPAAQPAQKEAVANLFKAKKALDERIEDLQKQLGLEAVDPAALAEAAAQIEEMQQDTAMAAEEMTGDPNAIQQSLEEQQQDIANALQKMNAAQPSPALEKAQQAAAKAAQQLAQNQLPQAAQSMGQAQKGMQAAQKDPQAPPALPQVEKKQEELKQLTEALAAGQPIDAMEQASEQFGDTAMDAGQLAAGSPLPSSAASALQQAAAALSQAAAQSAAGNQPAAQAAAQTAQTALAKAAASLALAQAGLSGQMASAQAQQPGQGQMPGQGQQPGQGPPSQKPGKANENKPSPNSKGTRQDTNSNVQNGGPRRDEKSAGKFLALPARDRAALTQSQNDKYPEEYGAQIEQYLRNLAEEEK